MSFTSNPDLNLKRHGQPRKNTVASQNFFEEDAASPKTEKLPQSAQSFHHRNFKENFAFILRGLNLEN